MVTGEAVLASKIMSTSTGTTSTSTVTSDPPSTVYVKVHFLDNSYKTFLIPLETKVQDLCPQICEKLGFANVAEDGYWFGLYESINGTALDRPLSNSEVVGSLVHGWGRGAPNKLVFLIKLFFDALKSSQDDTVQFYRYIQGVHSVVTGQYIVDQAMAVKLAALQFRAKFGDEIEFDKEFLGGRIVEFLPQIYLQQRRADEWNEEIQAFFDAHDEIKSLSEKEARTEYLRELESLTIYGSTLYPVTLNPLQTTGGAQGEAITLAVTNKGLFLYKVDSPEPYHMYELRDLLRWGYVPGSTFYVSSKSEGGKNHVFGTPVGNNICESMTSYAFGWLRHAEILKERAKRAAEAGETVWLIVASVNIAEG